MASIGTRHQWIDALEKILPRIATLNLKELEDKQYTEQAGNTSHIAYDDALKLSNAPFHNEVIARAVAALYQRCPVEKTAHIVSTMLGSLTSRSSYGSFCELATYAWLADNDIAFTPQVDLTAQQVLNPNGCTIDGELEFPSQEAVFFDVKAFGFYEHKIAILKRKLDQEFGEGVTAVEGAWDVSIDFLESLLHNRGLIPLIEELKVGSSVKRGTLEISIRAPDQNSMQSHATTPTKLAWENRHYPLRYAKQFTKSAPFLLVCVIHPWFSQGDLHQNFAGYADILTRELAYQAFFSFTTDITIEYGMTPGQSHQTS